ncbi:hypothetical protein BLA29_007085, partial [Euroglyphus maynei]
MNLLINSIDYNGHTPLTLSLKLKRSKIAMEILSNVTMSTASLIIKDNDNNNLFHWAALNDANICEKLCQLIGEQSIIQDLINQKNRQNETPMHIACNENNAECIKVLLKNGANINSASNRNDYNHHYVHSEMNQEFINKLDVNDKIKNGGTPLHWCENADIIDLLAENGCDLSAKDFNGNTALHIMIAKSDLNCTLSLLSNGADVNAIGSDGNSPLHLAVKIDNPTIVQALIVFGAKVNIINSNNHHSARHLAATSNLPDSSRKKIVFILHSLGAIRCDYKKSDCNEYCSPCDTDDGFYNDNPLQRNNPIMDELLWKNLNRNINERRSNKLLCLDGG